MEYQDFVEESLVLTIQQVRSLLMVRHLLNQELCVVSFLQRHKKSKFCYLQKPFYAAPRIPFIVTFITDDNEADTGSTTEDATTSEFVFTPGGIVGFSLEYTQVTCT